MRDARDLRQSTAIFLAHGAEWTGAERDCDCSMGQSPAASYRELTNTEPDPASFEEADKDSNGEIKVLDDSVAHRGRKVDAAAAEIAGQRALLLHDLGGQRTMENRDQHAHQQSYDFYGHCGRSLGALFGGSNQRKNLVQLLKWCAEGAFRRAKINV